MEYLPNDAQQGHELEIFYAVDDAYVVPLIASLSALSSANRKYDVHASITVLSNNLSTEHLQLVRQFGRDTYGKDQFSLTDITTLLPADLPLLSPHNTYISGTAYARFLVPMLAKARSNRSLYLDADTLVTGDLSELTTVDLLGRPVAAVRDHIISNVSHPQGLPNWIDLGLEPDSFYFNSGVLLFDNAAWRSSDLTDRLYSYCRQRGEALELFDQEALNAVAGRDIHVLDASYNVFTNHLCDETVPGEAPLQRDPLDPSELARARIIHFIGHLKPWKHGDTPSAENDLFFSALKQTPISGWSIGDVITGGR